MITPEQVAEIEKATGQHIKSVAPLSAANNAVVYRLTLPDGTALVAKIANYSLEDEAFMLRYLKEKTKLPVPGVLHASQNTIIMEFIQADWHIDAEVQENAAELLAGLHSIHSDSFGFERNTPIGTLMQLNTPSKDWVDFFINNRLLYMAKKALEEGRLDKAIMQKIEKLAKKIPAYIAHPATPSLIHGDVWGGNVLPARGHVAAFLDPAIYFADPEIELAFTTLFNTFDKPFFERYNALRPIGEGFFDVRKDIYNIYPLLVHARLFGAAYIRKIEPVLKRLL